MALIFPTSGLSLSNQQWIANKLTLKAMTKKKGQLIYGPPFPWYVISEDKKYIAIPRMKAPTIFPGRTPFDMSEYQIPRPYMKFTGTLLERQESAMEEARHHLITYGSANLHVYPGFGKTASGVYLSTLPEIKQTTLVLLCIKSLIPNWVKAFENMSTCKVVVVDSKTKKFDADVFICMTGMVKYIPQEQLLSIGTVILDEAERLCTPSVAPVLLSVFPKYLIVCTATPTRPDGLHSMLHDLSGTHAVVRKNPKPFNVVKLNTNFQATEIHNTQGLDWTMLCYSLYFSPERNLITIDCLRSHADYKILVLTSFSSHVNILYGLCEHYGLDADTYAGPKKVYRDSRILIGNAQKIGTGFDQEANPNYQGERFDLLVICTSTKQANRLEQNVGRVFRADMPNVIHLTDKNKQLKYHWNLQQKWYVEAKGQISEHTWTESNSDIDVDEFNEVHSQILQNEINQLKIQERKSGKKNPYLTWLDSQNIPN